MQTSPKSAKTQEANSPGKNGETDPAQGATGSTNRTQTEQTAGSNQSRFDQANIPPPPPTQPRNIIAEIELPGNHRLLSHFSNELGKILSPHDIFWRLGKCVIPKPDEKGIW
jgi:hypothetical protein